MHEANLKGLAFGGIKLELVSDRLIKEVINIPLYVAQLTENLIFGKRKVGHPHIFNSGQCHPQQHRQ